MTFDALKELMPEYAKDHKLNLGAISRSTVLKDEQLWGCVLACAAATRNATVLRMTVAETQSRLTEATRDAALGAAAIMGMNNVFYRGRGYLGDDYANERPGLRMNIIANPGVPKADFELWSLAVSAINGCEHCVTAHENTVRGEGLSRESVFEALRIAAIMAGVAEVVTIVEATTYGPA